MSDEECETHPDGEDPSITRDVRGPFLERFRSEGGVDEMGLPVSGEQDVLHEVLRTYGDRMMAFQKGTIYVRTETGESRRLGAGWFAYTPLKEADGETPP